MANVKDLVIRLHLSDHIADLDKDPNSVAEEIIAETNLDVMHVVGAHWEPCPPN